MTLGMARTEPLQERKKVNTMGKCILIGAGDLTMGELSVTEEDYVIAVDGGLLLRAPACGAGSDYRRL